jgi:hypothetical protein
VEDGVRRVYDHALKHVGWLPPSHSYERHGDLATFERMQHLAGGPYTFDPEEVARALVRRLELNVLGIDYGRETVLAYVAPHGVDINELRELRGWRDA